MKKNTRLAATAALALLPVAAAAAEALELSRVEVTGSRMLRSVGEGSAPLRTLQRAEIERSGASTVAELLERLPQMQGMLALSIEDFLARLDEHQRSFF